MSVNNHLEGGDVAAQARTRKATERATTTKVCTRCKKRRKVGQFYRDKHMKDGLSSWCKSCARDYDREYAARKRAEKVAK
jgi:hypothetical protein